MYIIVDLGKTTTRVASSKDLKTAHKIEKFSTNPEILEQKKLLGEAILKVSEGETIKMGCLGLPGILDREKNEFIRVSMYPVLNGSSYMYMLEGCMEGFQVYVENDALLSAYGEALGGSGKEFNVVAYLTLSTGVGGARITYKELDTTFLFSEPGHQIIVEGGRLNKNCHQQGCLESYVSGTAFKEIYGMDPADCNDEKIWTDYSSHLATGIINVMSMWAPEVVVLGGGVSQKFDLFYPSLIDNLKSQSFFPVPEIRKSAFGDDSGINGGLIYLRQFLSISSEKEL